MARRPLGAFLHRATLGDETCPQGRNAVTLPAVRRLAVSTSTVTSKGQITLPKQIREHLHVAPGDRIDFVVEESGQVVVRPTRSRLRQLRGMLRARKRKPVSVDQMDAAIEHEHSRR